MSVSRFMDNHFLGKRCTFYCSERTNYALVFMIVFLSYALSCGFCDDSAMVSVPLGFKVSGFDRNTNWVSENGLFAFGFFDNNNVIDDDDDDDEDDEYVVGIRYNLGEKGINNLPVWTVGGGLKVSKNSTFALSMDGRLILITNPNQIIVWSSNTSSLGVQKASLLNNGNLVLLGSKCEVLWESFTSPTSTLLPGQNLRYPLSLRAPSKKSISSYYSLVIRQSGQLALVWEHNVTYWKSRFSSTSTVKEARFDETGVLGLYDEDEKVIWSASSTDIGDPFVSLRHLRIDQDGNLRIYSWNNASRVWRVGWQAVEDQCNVFGTCGLYGICGYNSTGMVCECLYSDSLDSGGSECKKMVDLENCMMHTSMDSMKQTVLYGLYPPHDTDMLLSEESCQEFCVNDSTCIAATSVNDGSRLCTIKRTSFISGYTSPLVPSVSFLKTCSVPQAARGANPHSATDSIPLSSQRWNGKKFVGALVLVVFITVFVVVSVQVTLFWVMCNRRASTLQMRIPFDKMNPHYSGLIRLSFEEVKELTSDFTSQIGPSVYKGELPNKVQVVAKILDNVVVSEKDFRVAVSKLGGTHHRNLASVEGFCFEPRNKVLLYEYLPNGSLERWLFSQDQNERIWQQRVDVALQVARAIAYLHTECQQCIPHGNLKLENVLLDNELVPKVTDFGLHGLVLKQEDSFSGSLAEKDVYMLGQMLLQIVTCKRDVVGTNVQEILCQVDEARLKLVDSDDMKSMESMVRISLWCMQSQPFLRPSIGEVVKVLEGTLSVDRPPSDLVLRQDSMADSEIEEEC